MGCPGAVGLALVLLAQVAFAADVLVLKRIWQPSGCATADSCTQYPDSFSVGALQLASDASPTGQSGCKGKGGLKKAQLDAAGLTKDKLQCAWQNHSAGVDSIQTSWRSSWEDYGKCTPLKSAVAYLGLGLQLDGRYPLPQDLPATLQASQLAAAVAAAFGAEPYIQCSGADLISVLMCFDPSTVGAAGGPSLVDCPWTADAACTGQLAVPRGGQGLGECATYYAQSPVDLKSLAAVPASAPAAAPTPAPAAQPMTQPRAEVTTPVPAPAQPEVAVPAPAQEAQVPTPSQAQAAPVTVPAPAPSSTDNSGSTTTANLPATTPAPAPAEGAAVVGGAAAGSSTSTGSDQPSGGDGSSGGSNGQTSGEVSGSPAADPSTTNTGASSSSSSGTSTSSMVIALSAGIAGGIILGLAAFGVGYIIWNRRKRAAQSVAHAAALADPEKGCQVSTSGGSLSSWSSSSGDKHPNSRTSGPPSSGGSSGAKRSSSSGAKRSSSSGGGGGVGNGRPRGERNVAVSLMSRLDSNNSLPPRQDSQGSLQGSPGGSRMYRQTSNVSAAGSANSSPSKVYHQPGGPAAAAASPTGAAKLQRQKSSNSRYYIQDGPSSSGRLSTQVSLPRQTSLAHQASMGRDGATPRSPSKLSRLDSAGGGSRSPGRLYSQASGRSMAATAAAAAVAAGSSGSGSPALRSAGPSGEDWTDNPLADAQPAAAAAKPASSVMRTRSPSEKSLTSRLPAVSE